MQQTYRHTQLTRHTTERGLTAILVPLELEIVSAAELITDLCRGALSAQYSGALSAQHSGVRTQGAPLALPCSSTLLVTKGNVKGHA
mmetsp:Transcript_16140/g.32358  ORF Transcript_16140/g.32358 Transcript_16140/m.32358 type:complete len:87 (-) Transcript_16140:660-920(-)